MTINDIKNDTILICDTNISYRSIYRFTEVLKNNKTIFESFKKIVFIINFDDKDYNYTDFGLEDLYSARNYKEKHYQFFLSKIKLDIQNSIVLYNPINRGWQIGAMDLHKMGYDYVKLNYPDCKWVIKTSTDIMLDRKFFDIQIDNADFFGLPFAENSQLKEIAQRFNNRELLTLMLNNLASPLKYLQLFQSTIFIFKNNSFDYLYYSNNFLKNIWKRWLIYQKNNNDISIDKRFGLHVETFLLYSIIRNNIKSKLLFNIEQYIYFLNLYFCLINNNFNFDASLKNINLDDFGIMHYHPEQTFYKKINANFKNKTFNFGE